MMEMFIFSKLPYQCLVPMAQPRGYIHANVEKFTETILIDAFCSIKASCIESCNSTMILPKYAAADKAAINAG